MITITSEYLDQNWRILSDGGVLPTRFSDWDSGDAYTLDGIGPMPSAKVAFASVVIGDAKVGDTPLVIRLHKTSSGDGTYKAPDGASYKASAIRTEGAEVTKIDVVIDNVAVKIDERRKGLFETDVLKDRSVLVVGLGTGGIGIALELAKAGVGKFILVDHDRLKVGNVTRHAAGVSFVGRKKVAASRDLILEKNPFAVVEIYDFAASAEREGEIQTLVRRSDIVVCATDGRASRLFVNKLCVLEDKTCFFGGAFRRAHGGQVLRVKPGQSACYHCFVLTMPEREADHEISSPENADAIQYSDRPVAVEPGLSLDVAPIAQMVAKLALQELLIGKESTLHSLDRDFTEGWYFWVNRPEPGTEYAKLPPLCDSTDEITIMRWYGVHLDKDPGCPACGDFAGTLRKVYSIEGQLSSISSLPDEPTF